MKPINTMLLLGLFFVCGVNQTFADPSTTPTSKPRVIIMGLDDTGSYRLWDAAKEIASNIVRQMAPGDIFYLRRITDASYINEATIFRLELPRNPAAVTDNPFDRMAKKHRKAVVFTIQRLKLQALKQIAELKSTKAGKTDIQGFLAVASEKFALRGTDNSRLLIIASDLRENVNYSPELNLNSSQVIVVGFQPLQDPKKTQKFKKYWVEYFRNLGANHIQFTRADEKVRLDQL
jgi:hypothetical protein